MVVLAISVCNKNAKIIFSRQFLPMSRLDLEEHIVHFSRHIDTCKDSTHIETTTTRYIFIPIENLYLVTITTINSNVIEDIEILKLAYRLFQDICGTVNSSNIIKNAYELVLGLDDIVTNGNREGTSLAQIKQLIAMESLEEKEYKKQLEEKEKQVKKLMQERMKEIEKQKRENRYNPDAVSR